MTYLFILALALTVSPALAVNKCVDAAGKVSYQEAACPHQGQKLELPATAGNTDRGPLAAQFEELAQARNALYRALEDRIKACGPGADMQPAVGMTEAEFLCTRSGIVSVGKINETETAAGVSKQYVLKSGATRYVYVTNGLVTAVQR